MGPIMLYILFVNIVDPSGLPRGNYPEYTIHRPDIYIGSPIDFSLLTD